MFPYSKFEELREARGITNYRVAKETGIPPSTFTFWKKGVSEPKYEKMLKIAAFLGESVDYFYESKEQSLD